MRICPALKSIEPMVQASVSIFKQGRAECRRARISRLQFIQAAAQFPRQPRLVDLEVLRNSREIAIGGSSSFDQVMLDLDVIVRAGQTKSGSGFQRRARCVVKFADQ